MTLFLDLRRFVKMICIKGKELSWLVRPFTSRKREQAKHRIEMKEPNGVIHFSLIFNWPFAGKAYKLTRNAASHI